MTYQIIISLRRLKRTLYNVKLLIKIKARIAQCDIINSELDIKHFLEELTNNQLDICRSLHALYLWEETSVYSII